MTKQEYLVNILRDIYGANLFLMHQHDRDSEINNESCILIKKHVSNGLFISFCVFFKKPREPKLVSIEYSGVDSDILADFIANI